MANKTYVLLDDVIAHIASCERSKMLPVECSAITLIKNIPAADVMEVRYGKWINAYPEIEPNPMFMYGICSVCGFEQSVSDKLKYCPNCGAKMEGVKNE